MKKFVLNLDNSWFKKDQAPFVISGPCSAETRQQVLDTADKIKKIQGVKALRAGIWKPRTRPNHFEGVGSQALAWLCEAREKTGLMIATEVLSQEHVRLCLKHNFDIVWIGARTTANPYMVQEIADALRGHEDLIVLVKNPISADLSLWQGALERLNQAGLKRLVAVHRGFKTYINSAYRNPPSWNIPVELKCQVPELLLFNDPSHISGEVDAILSVSQTALDLNFDGLMIETHISPDMALSDKKQQLNPEQLENLMANLKCHHGNLTSEKHVSQLEQLRSTIDEIDQDILSCLHRRMNIVKRIAEIKKELNLPYLQSERWNHVLESVRLRASVLELDENMVVEMFNKIHDQSLSIQLKSFKQESEDNTNKKI